MPHLYTQDIHEVCKLVLEVSSPQIFPSVQMVIFYGMSHTRRFSSEQTKYPQFKSWMCVRFRPEPKPVCWNDSDVSVSDCIISMKFKITHKSHGI